MLADRISVLSIVSYPQNVVGFSGWLVSLLCFWQKCKERLFFVKCHNYI